MLLETLSDAANYVTGTEYDGRAGDFTLGNDEIVLSQLASTCTRRCAAKTSSSELFLIVSKPA
jgi:hypothetical protein